jgi:transcriptional regulator with XRE-family HTH domain
MSESVRFTGRQHRYIEWLAETKYNRTPSTREELAKELGVSSRTLRRWQEKEGFGEMVKERTRELLRSDFPEILGALRREANKGSFQHIKLALEMLGEYTEHREVTGKDGGPIQFSEVVVEMPDDKAAVED